MAFVCAISGDIPQVPCVSSVSGCVFERSLLEKYVAEYGKDPSNDEPLTMDQVINIKASSVVKPKPPSATSIPAMLKSLQDEYDACMLSTFSINKNLNTTRQELSHALYQRDAACRVIVRLNKETVVAREALATLKPQSQTTQPAAKISNIEFMDTEDSNNGEPIGMSDEVIRSLQQKAEVLTHERKQRGKKLPSGLVSQDQIKSYRNIDSYPGLHSASTPGILCIDQSISNSSRFLTGGADKTAVVFDRTTEQIVTTLKGHTKKVTSVIYHPSKDVAITASPDSTIRVWSATSGKCSSVIKTHKNAVTGISLHALGNYLLSCSTDQHWAFSDIITGQTLCRVTEDDSNAALTCTQFHPDGVIFGTGTEDRQVRIWDLKERTNVASFDGHTEAITSISFSENGYYLATAAKDSTVKLWDLRKLKNLKTLSFDEGYAIKSLKFDHSGTYLAVAGTDVRIYLSKQWQELLRFTNHSEVATGVVFGENASYLASTSMDRSLKIYGN